MFKFTEEKKCPAAKISVLKKLEGESVTCSYLMYKMYVNMDRKEKCSAEKIYLKKNLRGICYFLVVLL
jgi:hypothetical protein